MSDTADSDLAAALAEARASDERSRRFLADAAHQLRTPIAGIQACAETLLREPAQPERDRLLARVIRETSRATRLVHDLLTIARLEQGDVGKPSACDVAGVCTDEADRAWALAPRLDIVLRAAELTCQPEVNADALREGVANLLDNARRHASRGIEVELEVVDHLVEVCVRDDGPGLSEEVVERAFERFVSLDAMGGSGLGLPIARALARANGGDVIYRDHCFVLRLPCRHDPAAEVGKP